jgi:molecular chaperone IbpA
MTKSVDQFFNSVLKQTVGAPTALDNYLNIAGYTPSTYPPHNVVAIDDAGKLWHIEYALAGWDPDDIKLYVEDGWICVEANTKEDDDDAESTRYQHRGIAKRSFTKRLNLAENYEVTGASMENGLLTVVVEFIIPEEKLPKYISINRNSS